MPSQVVLITAASGHIGTDLVPLLLEKDFKVVLPTSNAERLRSKLPSAATEQNVAVEQGSIDNPRWLQEIMQRHDVTAVFLALTGTDELFVTLNFFDAMQRVNTVKQLVYISGCGDYTSDEGFRNVVASQPAAHVIVKPIIERKLLYTDYGWTTTVLGPTLFWDNDLRSKDSIMQGYFDEPLGQKGVSRVSTSDIATAARNVMLEPSRWAGKKIMVGSKRAYSGDEIAALWSKAIGREVTICPDTKDGFETYESEFFEKSGRGVWARDLRLMYEGFAMTGFAMTDEQYQLQVECLGRQAADYEAFVRETGRAWTSGQ